jgi:hypothetical protein
MIINYKIQAYFQDLFEFTDTRMLSWESTFNKERPVEAGASGAV